jgi:hypothetical protein
MATRMQQRRGTAAQWVSSNAGAGPILNAGEIGWESDTNKFKIGDGVNNWSNLDYFADINSTINPAFGTSITFEGATADSYETVLQVTDPTADRTITLPNVTGTVITTGNLSDITDIGVFSSTITMEGSSADDYELTLSAGNPTADRTITFPDATGTVALTSALSSYAPLNSPTFTGTVTLPNNTISQSMMGDDSVGTNEIGGLAVTEGKIADGAVTSAKIANGTIINEDINASAAIALSKLATDPLARANHSGTQTASTISDFDTQVRTNRLDQMAAPSASVSLNAQKITGLATPTDSTDAATKAYVDAVTEGLHIHAAVVAATTTNVTLASALENGDTLDGIVLATGNRILVKNQTTTSENGIYVVQASGQPSRATDFDTASEVDSGDFVFVYSGTVNGSTGWVQTNQPATIGTDPIVFTQFSGAGTYTAGTGLTLDGTVFSINTGTTVDLSTSQTLTNKTLTSPVITGLTLNDSSIVFEGTTANDFETTLEVTNPTEDRTITFPDATGTVALTESLTTSLSGQYVEVVDVGNIDGVPGLDGSKNILAPAGIIFEGTANDFETTFQVTDPTEDRTITLPNLTGTVSLLDAAETLSNKTLSSAVATTALTLNATAELRLADTDSTHYVGFKSPATVSTNKIWTLPAADGTAGQALTTNGSGTLSWSASGGGAAFSELMLIGA